MHELIRLLTEFGADADLIALATRLVAPAETDSPLSDDELTALRTGLAAFAEDDEATAALLSECVSAVQAIDTVVAERTAEEEAEAADREAQRAILRGEAPAASTTEPEGDESEGDGDEPGDGEGTDDGATTEADEVEIEAEAVPVTASARPAARRALRAGASRRATARAEDDDGPRRASMALYADIPGFASGQPIESAADMDRALWSRWSAFRYSPGGSGFERYPVGHIDGHIPEDRMLCDSAGRPLAAEVMIERVQAALADARRNPITVPNSMTAASGGLACAPVLPYYGVESLGEDSQPVRETALVTFGASRGGVITIAPPTLPALSGSVGEWTLTDDENAAEDTDPDDPDVPKDILDVDCTEQRTTYISGIYRRLRFRNIRSRTFPEYDTAFTNLSLVWQARFAEQWRLAKIKAGSVNTTQETTTVSATRDVLNFLARSASNERIHHRLPNTFPFRCIIPAQLRDIMREDLSKTIPGGSQFENLNIADATINSFFSSRYINVTWSPDMVVPSEQTTASVYDWPTSVEIAMYPEGTWLALDAGSIDLGVIRDSRTAAANTFQTFAEFFEGVHLLGVFSLWHKINVCPSGAVNGTLDPAAQCASYT